MVGKRQFSMAFVLFELACIATAFAAFRAASMPEIQDYRPLFFLPGIAATGMTIGGFFQRPILGAILALLSVGVVAFFLPTVQ